MRRSVWKWIGLGASVMLLLVYFMELTSNGLQRMNKPSYIVDDFTEQTNKFSPSLASSEDEITITQSRDINMDSEIEQELVRLENEILQLKKKALEQEKVQLEQLLLNDESSQSNVNKLADTTSGALQSLSSSGLQFVAELFHKVIN